MRERQVFAGPGTYYYLGGAFISFSMGTGPSGAIPTAVADIKPQMNNGVITSVTANGLRLEGPTLDLRAADLPIGQAATTWNSGDSSATLLVQSAGGNLIRVCWDVNLPAAQRVERLKRTMCGVYDVNQPGKDVGGYIRDTIGSGVIEYTGTW